MGKLWTLITQLHSLAELMLTLLYPLNGCTTTSRVDANMVRCEASVVAWLVLLQFKGAAFLYERFVREHIRKYVTGTARSEHKGKHP
ncbi:HVA22-like protein e [Senna tora]|uniref:HVA22-like protein e n=1 Tax=Senna tora TaxID=362788 RepID=A0A834T8L8_9FABA|nr:HVA22-like protein e [Senna tora]